VTTHKKSWSEIYNNTDLSTYELYYHLKQEIAELTALENTLRDNIKKLMKKRNIRYITIKNTNSYLYFKEKNVRKWNTKDLLRDIPQAEEYYIPHKAESLVLLKFSDLGLRFKSKEITKKEHQRTLKIRRDNNGK
jgi:glutamate-1-semialdehyde aminotransferase